MVRKHPAVRTVAAASSPKLGGFVAFSLRMPMSVVLPAHAHKLRDRVLLFETLALVFLPGVYTREDGRPCPLHV